MISVFDHVEDCCGCTACKSICPTHAIAMKPDEEGFLYPEINQDLCISCGICRNVCVFQNGYTTSNNLHVPDVYAVKHRSDNVRKNSSSGGVYTAISDYILSKNGVVYGAMYDDTFHVIHKREETSEGRNRFRGSKYIQSDLKEVYNQVKIDLLDSRFVLFTGTACQVAGLKKYFEESKVKTDRLILNDIICHGTPSPLLWEKYLSLIQKKGKLKSYTFRAKEKGWRGNNVKAEYENGNVHINNSDIMIFINLFYSNLSLRPSCYQCKFCNLNRPADITIGDFWGVEESLPEIDDGKGISLVVLNTLKGKDIFDIIKDFVISAKSNITDCLQPNLQHPTKIPGNRMQFWLDYRKLGFKYIAKRYAGYSFKVRARRFMRKLGL